MNRFPTTNLKEFILFLIGVFIISIAIYGICFGFLEFLGYLWGWLYLR